MMKITMTGSVLASSTTTSVNTTLSDLSSNTTNTTTNKPSLVVEGHAPSDSDKGDNKNSGNTTDSSSPSSSSSSFDNLNKSSNHSMTTSSIFSTSPPTDTEGGCGTTMMMGGRGGNGIIHNNPASSSSPPNTSNTSITSNTSNNNNNKKRKTTSMRIRITNGITNRSKDLVVDISPNNNLYEVVYDSKTVKEAHVRKWSKEIVQKVKSNESEIQCCVCLEKGGQEEDFISSNDKKQPLHWFTVDNLKKTSTSLLRKMLFPPPVQNDDTTDESDFLINLVLKIVPYGSNQQQQQQSQEEEEVAAVAVADDHVSSSSLMNGIRNQEQQLQAINNGGGGGRSGGGSSSSSSKPHQTQQQHHQLLPQSPSSITDVDNTSGTAANTTTTGVVVGPDDKTTTTALHRNRKELLPPPQTSSSLSSSLSTTTTTAGNNDDQGNSSSNSSTTTSMMKAAQQQNQNHHLHPQSQSQLSPTPSSIISKKSSSIAGGDKSSTGGENASMTSSLGFFSAGDYYYNSNDDVDNLNLGIDDDDGQQQQQNMQMITNPQTQLTRNKTTIRIRITNFTSKRSKDLIVNISSVDTIYDTIYNAKSVKDAHIRKWSKDITQQVKSKRSEIQCAVWNLNTTTTTTTNTNADAAAADNDNDANINIINNANINNSNSNSNNNNNAALLWFTIEELKITSTMTLWEMFPTDDLIWLMIKCVPYGEKQKIMSFLNHHQCQSQIQSQSPTTTQKMTQTQKTQTQTTMLPSSSDPPAPAPQAPAAPAKPTAAADVGPESAATTADDYEQPLVDPSTTTTATKELSSNHDKRQPQQQISAASEVAQRPDGNGTSSSAVDPDSPKPQHQQYQDKQEQQQQQQQISATADEQHRQRQRQNEETSLNGSAVGFTAAAAANGAGGDSTSTTSNGRNRSTTKQPRAIPKPRAQSPDRSLHSSSGGGSFASASASSFRNLLSLCKNTGGPPPNNKSPKNGAGDSMADFFGESTSSFVYTVENGGVLPPIKRTMRIRLTNGTTKRSKDLVVDISLTNNLFDSIYDQKSVKEAHIRKWGKDITQKVKSKQSEIQCAVWNDEIDKPLHWFTLDDLKKTSTSELQDMVPPDVNLVPLILNCVPYGEEQVAYEMPYNHHQQQQRLLPGEEGTSASRSVSSSRGSSTSLKKIYSHSPKSSNAKMGPKKKKKDGAPLVLNIPASSSSGGGGGQGQGLSPAAVGSGVDESSSSPMIDAALSPISALRESLSRKNSARMMLSPGINRAGDSSSKIGPLLSPDSSPSKRNDTTLLSPFSVGEKEEENSPFSKQVPSSSEATSFDSSARTMVDSSTRTTRAGNTSSGRRRARAATSTEFNQTEDEMNSTYESSEESFTPALPLVPSVASFSSANYESLSSGNYEGSAGSMQGAHGSSSSMQGAHGSSSSLLVGAISSPSSLPKNYGSTSTLPRINSGGSLPISQLEGSSSTTATHNASVAFALARLKSDEDLTKNEELTKNPLRLRAGSGTEPTYTLLHERNEVRRRANKSDTLSSSNTATDSAGCKSVTDLDYDSAFGGASGQGAVAASILGQPQHPLKTTLRIRITNKSSQRFKDLVVDIRDDINLHDAIYNNPTVKEAHVRKWSKDIVQKVKTKKAEIQLVVWDDDSQRPWKSLTVEDLKETSTRQLFHLVESNDLVQLFLVCAEKGKEGGISEMIGSGSGHFSNVVSGPPTLTLDQSTGRPSISNLRRSSIGNASTATAGVTSGTGAARSTTESEETDGSLTLTLDQSTGRPSTSSLLRSVRSESHLKQKVLSDIKRKPSRSRLNHMSVNYHMSMSSRTSHMSLSTASFGSGSGGNSSFNASFGSANPRVPMMRRSTDNLTTVSDHGPQQELGPLHEQQQQQPNHLLNMNKPIRRGKRPTKTKAKSLDIDSLVMKKALGVSQQRQFKQEAAETTGGGLSYANQGMKQKNESWNMIVGPGIPEETIEIGNDHFGGGGSGSFKPKSRSNSGIDLVEQVEEFLRMSAQEDSVGGGGGGSNAPHEDDSLSNQDSIPSDKRHPDRRKSSPVVHAGLENGLKEEFMRLCRAKKSASYASLNKGKFLDRQKSAPSGDNQRANVKFEFSSPLQTTLNRASSDGASSMHMLVSPSTSRGHLDDSSASTSANGRTSNNSVVGPLLIGRESKFATRNDIGSRKSDRTLTEDNNNNNNNMGILANVPNVGLDGSHRSNISSNSIKTGLVSSNSNSNKSYGSAIAIASMQPSTAARISRFLQHSKGNSGGGVSGGTAASSMQLTPSIGDMHGSLGQYNMQKSVSTTSMNSASASGRRGVATSRAIPDIPPISEIAVIKSADALAPPVNTAPAGGVSLSPELVKEVFPYHVVLDHDFRIMQVGISLSSLIDGDQLIGRIVSDILMVSSPIPMFGKWDWNIIDKVKDKTIFVESVLSDSSHRKVKIKGTIIEISPSPRQVMLSLLPNVKNLSELEELNLSMADLPLHSCQREAVLLGEHNRSEVNLTNHLDQLHRDLIDSMEKQIEDRTNELATANEDLERANAQLALQSARQLEHFACMSHEIRTPLNCIVGMSSLLLDDAPHMDPMHADSIKMISTSGELLKAVVDDVLDYAKLESGSFEVDIKPTNLQDTLDSVVHSISQKVREKNIRLRTHFSPMLPKILETDSRRLQQVLYNLLGNAGKFSKVDSVIDLSVTFLPGPLVRPNGEPVEDGDSVKNIIRFSVKDYGKGIEKKDFQTIFQPFSQASKETQNIYGGTGLGLSITSKLVHRLGGIIMLDSEFGKFAEFTVDLPFRGTEVGAQDLSRRLADTTIVYVESERSFDYSFANYAIKPEPEPFGTEILRTYGLDVMRSGTLSRAYEQIQERKAITPNCHFAVLLQEDLYLEAIFDHLDAVAGHFDYTLITFGPNYSVQITKERHIKSVRENIPAVLIESIATNVECHKKRIAEYQKNSGAIPEGQLGSPNATNQSISAGDIATAPALPVSAAASQAGLFAPLEAAQASPPANATGGLFAPLQKAESSQPDVPVNSTSVGGLFAPLSAEKPASSGGLFAPLSAEKPVSSGGLFAPLSADKATSSPDKTVAKEPLFSPLGSPIVPSPKIKDISDVKSKGLFAPLTDSGSPSLGLFAPSLATTNNKPKHTPKTDAKSLRGKLKVLYAEDNLVNQKVLSRVLNRAGIKDITMVDDGKKAVDITRTVKFDCIFMDMQMPVMGGMEATKLIVEHDPTAKVVFVTAHALDDFKKQAIAVGATSYISKPFRLVDIENLLDNLPALKDKLEDSAMFMPPAVKSSIAPANSKKVGLDPESNIVASSPAPPRPSPPNTGPTRPRPSLHRQESKRKVAPERNLNVLYAEDNAINQKVLSRVLNRAGIKNVTIVDNGKKAVDITEKVKFDCIFMDMQMPIMGGMEATKLIVERDPSAKVIFVSAHALDEYKAQAVAVGALKFISKPCRLVDIENLLQSDIFDNTKSLGRITENKVDEVRGPSAVQTPGRSSPLTESKRSRLGLFSALETSKPEAAQGGLFAALETTTPAAIQGGLFAALNTHPAPRDSKPSEGGLYAAKPSISTPVPTPAPAPASASKEAQGGGLFAPLNTAEPSTSTSSPAPKQAQGGLFAPLNTAKPSTEAPVPQGSGLFAALNGTTTAGSAAVEDSKKSQGGLFAPLSVNAPAASTPVPDPKQEQGALFAQLNTAKLSTTDPAPVSKQSQGGLFAALDATTPASSESAPDESKPNQGGLFAPLDSAEPAAASPNKGGLFAPLDKLKRTTSAPGSALKKAVHFQVQPQQNLLRQGGLVDASNKTGPTSTQGGLFAPLNTSSPPSSDPASSSKTAQGGLFAPLHKAVVVATSNPQSQSASMKKSGSAPTRLHASSSGRHLATTDSTANDKGGAKDEQTAFRENLKVLYAEDNFVNQKVLSRVLNRAGIKDITIVDDGKKAVEIAKTVKFDCIFMDMQMPVMGGMEATKLIVERDPTAKVVFVTAHALEDFKKQAIAVGATSYVSKPFRLVDIENLLESLRTAEMKSKVDKPPTDSSPPRYHPADSKPKSIPAIPPIPEGSIGSPPPPKVVAKSGKMERLPATVSPKPASAPSRPSLHRQESKRKVAPERKLKVLYAEDNVINQKVLSRVLNRAGIKDVTIVDNGKKAVEITEKVKFDCVFMDMQMPIMGGIEATKLIVDRDPAAKVIFVSAHALDEYKAQAAAVGALEFISKPCRLVDIENLLNSEIFAGMDEAKIVKSS